jgi:DNA-directed RNA polymerase specialized sigma24 family protein
LIDRARRRAAVRHGGGLQRVEIEQLELNPFEGDGNLLLAVNDALDRLAALDAPKAELVKLRYFAGLTLEDTAAAMDISLATAKRWWTFARAWLYHEIRP